VGLALLIFFTVLFVLKPVNAHLAYQRDNPIRHLLKTLKNKDYRIAYLATAFMSLGGYLMMPWGSAYSVNNIGVLQRDLPLLFMVVGIATFIVMPLVGSISDRFNKFQVFAFASIQMVIAVLIYTNLPKVNLMTLIAVNIFMMTGIMARMVPSQALNASIPGIADRGAFMSINSSLQQLSGGLAALLGGVIVLQKNEFSPLERFDLLGWVVVGVILLNIYFTRRVYNLAIKRS
jgi:predicted MFS family arabinose efflux permease